MGARVRCASETIRTIWARSVSAPTRSARITKPPVPFTVPPVTRLPGAFATGMDSPVTIDSSTALRPSSTTPSTGTRSPGRTRRRSPGRTSASGTSSSLPSSRRRRAVFGARPSSARMAPDVALRARSSSTWPRRTSVTITAAASKYTGGAPPWRTPWGKAPGASMAKTLQPNAAAVPRAISVNMFRLRVTRDCQPRTKKGQPPQSTTGAASRS